MNTRKKPVRHAVHAYTKSNGTRVRSYARGSGTKVIERNYSPPYFEPKPSGKRWEQIASGPDYQWRSRENPHITVNVNKEELNEDELEDEYGEDYDKEEFGYEYLVFPSYDNRGIPNSPDVYGEGSSGNIKAARSEAIEMAKRIMKLPIEKIGRFDWEMVD